MVDNIKDKSDKQKLLKIYVPIIQDCNEDIVLSYNELRKQIRLNFNQDFTIEDIRLYFEPTIDEYVDDLSLTLKNSGLIYV